MWATNWDTGFVLVILCCPFFSEKATGKLTQTQTHTHHPQLIYLNTTPFLCHVDFLLGLTLKSGHYIYSAACMAASLTKPLHSQQRWANNSLNGITMADQFKLMRVGTMMELLLHLSLRYAVWMLVGLYKRFYTRLWVFFPVSTSILIFK